MSNQATVPFRDLPPGPFRPAKDDGREYVKVFEPTDPNGYVFERNAVRLDDCARVTVQPDDPVVPLAEGRARRRA